MSFKDFQKTILGMSIFQNFFILYLKCRLILSAGDGAPNNENRCAVYGQHCTVDAVQVFTALADVHCTLYSNHQQITSLVVKEKTNNQSKGFQGKYTTGNMKWGKVPRQLYPVHCSGYIIHNIHPPVYYNILKQALLILTANYFPVSLDHQLLMLSHYSNISNHAQYKM